MESRLTETAWALAPVPKPVRLARVAMRTRFEIVIADGGDPARLRAAGEEALEEIARLERLLSAYRPDSELSILCTTAGRDPMQVERPLFELLERAATLTAATDGAFDMTAGVLMRLWGFAGPTGDDSRLPTREQLDRARELVGFREHVRLDVETGTVGIACRGVRLDPGAIGKGFALDRAAGILREAGVRNAMLHGGTSTVLALGVPPDAEAWSVAVRDPSHPTRSLARVALRADALSVSAPHGRVRSTGGVSLGHVIDPRSGRPVQGAQLAAVVTRSGLDADALSTALLVLGPAGIDDLGLRFPDASLLVAAGGEATQTRAVGAAFVSPQI